MRFTRWLALTVLLLSVACQPGTPVATITLLDGKQVHELHTDERIPAQLLAQANLTLAPSDRLLYQGIPVPLDQLLPTNASVLQVRRASSVSLVTPDGQQTIQTAAFTVGEALDQLGLQLYAADRLDPPAETPIDGPLTVTYTPARQLTVNVEGNSLPIRSAASTVGEALAEAGIPLEGLDYSQPAESDPLPSDGQIKVVRVQESIQLIQKPIPYETTYQASDQVEIDHQQVLQAGQEGLSVSRVRIRYEDGQEVARQTESQSVVRPPTDRVVGYGRKIVTRSLDVPGGTIKYWRAVQAYATSYSPCRSDPNRCYPSTSLGLPVKKGVISVNPTWYAYMVGQQVYIPGYGLATIADKCGGCVGKPWVDLGYSDNDYQPWSETVTVYFLTPVPANILWTLN
jgi:uncharacterized protein YabE (DUF348 family)